MRRPARAIIQYVGHGTRTIGRGPTLIGVERLPLSERVQRHLRDALMAEQIDGVPQAVVSQLEQAAREESTCPLAELVPV